MIPFSDRNAQILTKLLTVWKPEHFLVIGAAAVAYHTGLEWRGTIDLDLTVASGVEGYRHELERIGWRRDGRSSQRWLTQNGAAVDVIPSAADLVRRGGFTWPDGGERLTLTGFRFAHEDAIRTDIASDIAVRIASLRSLVVLKIAAYLDRPWERDNDLKDIVQIMYRYVGDDDERRWSDKICGLSLNFEDVGPYVLGEELSARVDPAERQMIESFIEKVEDPSDPTSTLQRMTEGAPSDWDELDRLRERLQAFKRGFLDNSS